MAFSLQKKLYEGKNNLLLGHVAHLGHGLKAMCYLGKVAHSCEQLMV